MKYITRLLIALVVLAMLASCTPATNTTPPQGSGSLQSSDPDGSTSADAANDLRPDSRPAETLPPDGKVSGHSVIDNPASPELSTSPTPTGAPSSDDPPSGGSPDSTAPAFTVTTLANTDITARAAELWSFANRLYHTTDSDDRTLYSTETGSDFFGVVDDFPSAPDYFTGSGLHQLSIAADRNGRPIFHNYYGVTYRRVAKMTEYNIGEALDMHVIGSTDTRMTLAVTYENPFSTRPDQPEHHYNVITLAVEDGVWKVDDYRYVNPVDSIHYDEALTPYNEWDFMPPPTREQVLETLPHDRELMRAARRLYFLYTINTDPTYGFGAGDIDLATFEWESDQTFTFLLHDGAPYSVTFYTAAQTASRAPDAEIFDCTLDALPVEADYLDFFNTEFFNTRSDNGRAAYFPNQFLTSEYATPDDVDLYQLFYNGFTGEGDLSDEELAYCEANGFWMDLDIQRTTLEQMSEILNEYTGSSFGYTRNLDAFLYNPDTQSYYLCHGDTNYTSVEFTNGWYFPDGRITLRYTAVDYSYPNYEKPMELTLRRITADTYHILSNLPA